MQRRSWPFLHVDQTLDALLIAHRQKQRLVHTEAAVLPTANVVLDDFRLDLPLGQVRLEDRGPPGELTLVNVTRSNDTPLTSVSEKLHFRKVVFLLFRREEM